MRRVAVQIRRDNYISAAIRKQVTLANVRE
jgi:hypothetical protein